MNGAIQLIYMENNEIKKIAVYFKGGSGIEKPLDYNGVEIKEGDIMTHSWFHKGKDKFFSEYFPQLTPEDIHKRTHQPGQVVKWNEKGFFFGNSIDESNYLYYHDFTFKECKIVKMPCAVIDMEGNHCPEIVKHKIPGGDFVCERCYENYKQQKNK